MTKAAQPLVSIIIPCFNAQNYVAEAIRSALEQSYPHKEITVVDDGSTDGSLDVIRSFGGQVRVESGPNRGGSAARNRGLALAKGTFVQFLDADDLLCPEKIERQICEALDHPEQVTYCDEESVDMATGARIRVYSPDLETDPLTVLLLDGVSIPAMLHPRSLLDRIGGFREDLPCSQEYDLHLRLACAGVRFRHVRSVLFRVRKRPTSVSGDYSRPLRQMGNVLVPIYERLRTEGQLDDRHANVFALKMAAGCRHLLRRGYPEEACELFDRAMKLHRAGALAAYGPLTRVAVCLIGPGLTERIARLLRSPVAIADRPME